MAVDNIADNFYCYPFKKKKIILQIKQKFNNYKKQTANDIKFNMNVILYPVIMVFDYMGSQQKLPKVGGTRSEDSSIMLKVIKITYKKLKSNIKMSRERRKGRFSKFFTINIMMVEDKHMSVVLNIRSKNK